MFFNKDLKQEIKRLQAEVDLWKADADQAQGYSDELRQERDRLKLSLDGLQNKISEQKETISSLEKKIKKKDKLIREQTKADLLLNALQAVGIIPEEKEKEVDHFAEERRLMGKLDQQGRQGLQNVGMRGQAPLGVFNRIYG